jgi:hypothetical protein
MKKLIGTLAITALAVSVFAQGTVTFQNTTTGYVQKWTSTTDPTLVRVPTGGGYVELVTAPAGSTLASALGFYDAMGFNAGYTNLSSFLAANGSNWKVPVGSGSAGTASMTAVMAGLAGLFSGGNATINGITPGPASVNYMVIGWTGQYTTYDEAYAAAFGNPALSFLGASGVFTTGTGDPNGSPVGTPVNLKNTFTGMTLAPLVIPEPTSFALAGLGLAALLVFRRRN